MLQRKRVEALNSLSSFIYGLKDQIHDQEGLGSKLSDEDKKTIATALKEGVEWVDENGADASLEDLEEKLADIQTIVNPITAKLYQSGSPAGHEDDDDDDWRHGEL